MFYVSFLLASFLFQEISVWDLVRFNRINRISVWDFLFQVISDSVVLFCWGTGDLLFPQP